MKKFLNIVTPLIILLAILTACESSDMPIQHADNYAYISFSAKTEKTLTRTNPYEAYDAAKHPATMACSATIPAPVIPSLVLTTPSTAMNR